LLDSVQLGGGSYTNRVGVRSTAGAKWLTVPVKHHSGQLIRDVAIAETEQWRAKHLAVLSVCYGRHPFFDEVFPLVESCYAGGVNDGLAAFNENSIKCFADLLGVRTEIVRSSALGCTDTTTDLNLSLTRSVGASVYLSGQGGAKYQDQHEFERAGIELRYSDFVHPVYKQCEPPFVAGLSILDMLFSCGPTAVREVLCAKSV
jgi:hypothetical protein